MAVSEEVGVRVGVSEEVLVGEGLEDSVAEEVREGDQEGDSDPEEVREGDQEGDSDPEEVLVGEGLGDSDTEGLGDTGLYDTEKTGSPCAFVAMSMGLVNWRSVVVFAGTVTPVEVKSR